MFVFHGEPAHLLVVFDKEVLGVLVKFIDDHPIVDDSLKENFPVLLKLYESVEVEGFGIPGCEWLQI